MWIKGKTVQMTLFFEKTTKLVRMGAQAACLLACGASETAFITDKQWEFTLYSRLQRSCRLAACAPSKRVIFFL